MVSLKQLIKRLYYANAILAIPYTFAILLCCFLRFVCMSPYAWCSDFLHTFIGADSLGFVNISST